MIQTIGLIIAVYAVARLIQVPLELYGNRGKECLEPPRFTATIAIAAISGFGVLCLLVLTLMLLMQGSNVNNMR